MTVTVAIPVFPGTNCENDIAYILKQNNVTPKIMYHNETDLNGVDAVIIPGGFAHGDYLRTGAIARFSPIMSSIEEFARLGKPVLGICNGFQILCETGLLPGALQKNVGMKFISSQSDLEVCAISPLTSRLEVGQIKNIPISHFEGNYTCSDETYDELVENDQIILRYVQNPNGSRDSIAGICNVARNVVGLMPHPERATEEILGNTDGKEMILSFIDAAKESHAQSYAQAGA